MHGEANLIVKDKALTIMGLLVGLLVVTGLVLCWLRFKS